MKTKSFVHKQQGAATLLTAVVLLVSITLVALFTSKTVLVETQITADNYRTGQATAAASAAMDRAVAYFKAGGLDQTADTQVDYTSGNPFTFTLTSGAQTTNAQFYFRNESTLAEPNPCDCTPTSCMQANNMTSAQVTAQGWSDDQTAVRTISQCVTTFNIPGPGSEGPQQPFVSKAGVGVFGNAKIINRYNNSSIWSGGNDAVHGASYGTYLRPSGKEVADYSSAQLDSADENTNTQKVSSRDSGNGIDVITSDPTLGQLTSSRSTADLDSVANNKFFVMFFNRTKATVKDMASRDNRMLAAGSSLTGKTGLIWVNGNAAINNDVGTPTVPVILIVDGDLDLTGGNIYGVVYVTGELKIAGNPIVRGSMVSENGPNSGAGTLTLVYKPWLGDGVGGEAPPFIPGTGAIVAGSWKDW